MRIMRNLSAIFWKGLAALVPITVTLYALYWILVTAENLLRHLVPDALYFPGTGLALGVVIVFVFGVLMHLFLFERLVHLGSALLNRIPLVKSIYSALQDFFAYLGHRSTEELSRVVRVAITDDVHLVGFVTNANFAALSRNAGSRSGNEGPREAADPSSDEVRVAVYLPMSYQLGGYMVLLPQRLLTPLDLSVEDAMRMVLTAGVQSPGR
jgi:uncharacterized membrane protein